MVLGEETLRPLRQLGIPPTTVLSGPLCGARKSAAGFPCEESHAGPRRLVAVISLARSSSSRVPGLRRHQQSAWSCAAFTEILSQTLPGASSLLCRCFFAAAQENLPFRCWLKVIRGIVAYGTAN